MNASTPRLQLVHLERRVVPFPPPEIPPEAMAEFKRRIDAVIDLAFLYGSGGTPTGLVH